MKLSKLRTVWSVEFSKCKFVLSIDFENHCCFFYFSGSGEPSKSEMIELERLVHSYDNSIGVFPKTGLKKGASYCVSSTESFDLVHPSDNVV